MDKNDVVRRFVKKRSMLRKIVVVSVIAEVVFAMIMIYYTNVPAVVVDYERYIATILVWSAVNGILCFYIGTVMSVCPVCGMAIPTVVPGHYRADKPRVPGHYRADKPRVPGNGPLPDRCPYCSTNFAVYKDGDA